jgi:hypothetical protein
MATPTTKTFDSVEMSRRLRAETSRKLAGLTLKERLVLLNSHLRPSATSSAEQENVSSCAVREEPPEK